jgi:glucosamine--fructose-6-phosphate aminotransferase (isomerizing)
MNLTDEKYKDFALVKEMLETPAVIRNLDFTEIESFKVDHKMVLLTGEGSSRIFPAKNTVCNSLKFGYEHHIITENDSQAMEYKLDDVSVFAASNSGKTAEVVRLIRRLKGAGHKSITAVAAHNNTPIVNEAHESYILMCGNENAVAATKSVVEQALFYDILFRKKNNHEAIDLRKLGDAVEDVLTMDIPGKVVSRMAKAPIIYFSGRNNGAAEELRLKTNEITRKKADYLEGTYSVHGIEEVMREDEALIIIDPFEDELQKIRDVLVEGVGLFVVTVSDRDTGFPNIKIPDLGHLNPYLHLAAGWNLLVETGISCGIDLDKPERARKVGNEFTG